MMRAATLLLLGLAATPSVAVVMTPTQKVVQLMNGMIEKGKKEKHEEQVQFAAYKQFCDSTSSHKQTSIKTANEQLEVLEADVEQYQADAEDFTKQVARHDADIATWQGDLKASAKVRAIE